MRSPTNREASVVTGVAPALDWAAEVSATIVSALMRPFSTRGAPMVLFTWLRRDVAVMVDSGVRHGSDIAVALALGADACAIGRAYLYGLMAGGEPGESMTTGRRPMGDPTHRTRRVARRGI